MESEVIKKWAELLDSEGYNLWYGVQLEVSHKWWTPGADIGTNNI